MLRRANPQRAHPGEYTYKPLFCVLKPVYFLIILIYLEETFHGKSLLLSLW